MSILCGRRMAFSSQQLGNTLSGECAIVPIFVNGYVSPVLNVDVSLALGYGTWSEKTIMFCRLMSLWDLRQER